MRPGGFGRGRLLPPIRPGERRGGRIKGKPNKMTRLLKEAVLEAAEKSGYDQRGRDGLVGYLKRMADHHPETFTSSLLSRVMPLQITGRDGGPVELVHYKSVEEARAALKERGIPIDAVLLLPPGREPER
jgi:hypothetical protein